MSSWSAIDAVQVFRVVAVSCFGFSAFLPPVPSAGFGLVGLVVLALTLGSDRIRGTSISGVVRLPIVGLLVGMGVIGLSRGAIAYPDPAGLAPQMYLVAVFVCGSLLIFGRRQMDIIATVIALGLIAVLSIGVMLEFGGNLYGLDVYRSHEAAADALAQGANPYTNAVQVTDGSPNAEPGDVIEGYAYPPVTLLSFVSADWMAGDPRWATVVAVVGSLATAWSVARRGRIDFGVAAGVALLAAMPLNRAMVWSGWTEPLTVFLLALALVLWPRVWLAGLVLGLALATKQYMVVLVPLLLIAEGRPWKRSGIAGVVAVATLLPAAIIDFDSFWFTLVERPLSLGFRADTQSLSGAVAALGGSFEVPTWAMGVVVLATAAVAGRKSSGRADLAATFALVLGTTFFLSLAFVNYWWLVQWVAMLSIAFGSGDASAGEEGEAVIRSAVVP